MTDDFQKSFLQGSLKLRTLMSTFVGQRVCWCYFHSRFEIHFRTWEIMVGEVSTFKNLTSLANLNWATKFVLGADIRDTITKTNDRLACDRTLKVSYAYRVLWFLSMVIAYILAYVFIEPIYQQSLNSPTITSLSTTTYPIWNIHFPAVSICSNNKVRSRQLKTAIEYEP